MTAAADTSWRRLSCARGAAATAELAICCLLWWCSTLTTPPPLARTTIADDAQRGAARARERSMVENWDWCLVVVEN